LSRWLFGRAKRMTRTPLTQEGEIWAAIPKTNFKRSAKVAIRGQMTMENFEGKSLKKKFDGIVFGVTVNGSSGPAAHRGVAPAVAVYTPVANVARATGPNARNVAEVVQSKAPPSSIGRCRREARS